MKENSQEVMRIPCDKLSGIHDNMKGNLILGMIKYIGVKLSGQN